MFGIKATSVLAEAWRFSRTVLATPSEKLGWWQRYVLPTIRYVGGLLFAGAFIWPAAVWIVYDVPLAVAAVEGLIIYFGAVICLTFDRVWEKAGAALFLLYEQVWKRSRPYAPLSGENPSETWTGMGWLTGVTTPVEHTAPEEASSFVTLPS